MVNNISENNDFSTIGITTDKDILDSTVKKPFKKQKKKNEKIKVSYNGKEYETNKSAFFDFSLKDYKLQENQKKIQSGEVAVLFLRESGIAELKYVKPENGMFIVNGKYYHINDGSCIYSIGKKRIPLSIIPEWSFVPITRKNYEQSSGAKYQDAQSLIIKSIENAEVVKINQEVDGKSKLNMKGAGWIIIGLVAVVFIISKMTGAA